MSRKAGRKLTILPDESYREYISRCNPESIIRIVARRYGVSKCEITADDQRIKYLVPRQVAIYFLSCNMKLTMADIGAIFWKSHCTTLHSVRVVENMIAVYPERRLTIEKICERIMNHVKLAKRIQLIGKVTGLSYDYARQMFLDAELLLMDNGYEVINPMRLVPQHSNWMDAMKICLASLIDSADGYYRLNNWTHSRGAKIEYAVAEGLGMKEAMVIHENVTKKIKDGVLTS